jgi:hypothetical protein
MRLIYLTSTLCLFLVTTESRAQMLLPGAVDAPTPAGQTLAPPIAGRANPSQGGAFTGHFTAARPPNLDSILDKPLSLSGVRGSLLITKAGTEPRVSRLTAVGDKISRPNQSCEVSLGAAGPIGLKPLGAPDGVQRFELDSSTCPLQIDVLSGALRVRSPNGSCSFPEADCFFDASGLWGPSGNSFSESQVKSIEKERGSLENEVRSHFRTLLDKYKKDKPATQATIKEQAGFSAERAQICRDYDREEAVGFCALRLTESRDYRLQARLAGENGASKPDKPKKRAAAKPAPAPRAPAPPQ